MARVDATARETGGSAQNHRWLLAAGILCAAASLLHVAIIFGGPDWYRFFGAGERMARMAERGRVWPTFVTIVIAVVLLVWSLYAFSAARAYRHLSFQRTVLVLASTVFVLRGLAPLALLVIRPSMLNFFVLWSSTVILACGICFTIGTRQFWREAQSVSRASARNTPL